ncbi:MAG: S1 RNA-binding domain-containing protein, partial [Muribaculaceae bacterium]|nr:S1 RNA-binding domain-containing protein [Muribaculaceae bacterium]
MNIGRINRLNVNRNVEVGANMDGGNEEEILLPAKFMKADLKEGEEIDVFVYNDSEDRLIATTRRAKAMV